MAFLTDRSTIGLINGTLLVHVVDPSDFSQGNPAGSSYKATLQQINNYFNSLPFLDTTTGITTSTATLVTGYTYNGVSYLGNVDLDLPDPTGIDGFKIRIKDELGNAGTNRIRLTSLVGNIDNNSYVDMNINYMSLTLIARNNNWWII